MDIQTLSNINKSTYLTEKVEKIINDIEKNNDIKSIYNDCQILLEFINAFLLAQKFNIKIQKCDMMKIIDEYINIDRNLLKEMTTIVGEINMINNITINDVEYLLYKIDYIYGYMQEKYEITI